jgi:hypothetical protein
MGRLNSGLNSAAPQKLLEIQYQYCPWRRKTRPGRGGPASPLPVELEPPPPPLQEEKEEGAEEPRRDGVKLKHPRRFVLGAGATGGIGEGVEEPSWGGGVKLKLEQPPLSLCLRRRRQKLFSGGG